MGRTVLFIFGSILLFAACNPYLNHDGEFNAGGVDPARFPQAYLGAGGDPSMGGGQFVPIAASVDGMPVAYFSFPFPDSQLDPDTGMPSLALVRGGKQIAPLGYVFDPSATSPFPDPGKCVAPKDYVFDQRRDAVRYDQQGDVFTALPGDDNYVPIVTEVPVTSNGEPCQDIKSEKTLVGRTDITVPLTPPAVMLPDSYPTGTPDGKYLAWAIIDPDADVYLDPQKSLNANGLGPQQWGWFNHYLLAYIDGGYIPTKTTMVPGMAGEADSQIVDMVSKPIYFPSMHPDTSNSGSTGPVMGAVGEGFDVLTFPRSHASYSPICEVFSFDPKDPMNPETSVDDIDMSTAQATGDFIYCLQTE